MDMDIHLPKETSELTALKSELTAAIAGRLDGLEIDTPNHWAVASFEDARTFLEKLGLILPSGAILYVEGTSICDDARAVYTAHRAKNAVMVARDTIFPIPETFHFDYSPPLCGLLADLYARHERKDI
jgi:hypothetical protein